MNPPWHRKRDARPRRAAGADDALALALGMAGLAPLRLVDPMALGLVLERGESAYRVLTAWTSHRRGNAWSRPVQSRVVVTDRRLIVGMPLGLVSSFWWSSLVGFHPDLSTSSVVLDYGDGYPRSISGPDVPSVVVVGVVAIYGVNALAEHAALEPLRDPVARRA